MVSKMTMAGLGGMVMSTILIIVIYAVIPIIGFYVDNSVTITGDTLATQTFTFSGDTLTADFPNQTINISTTEQYVFINGSNTSEWDSYQMFISINASLACANFSAEVNANSTLASASTCTATNVTTVSALTVGTSGNNYATTENVTNGTWGAATMTGGVVGSNWNVSRNTDLPTAYGFWGTMGGFVTLTALMVFVASFIMVLKGIKD